MSTCASRHRFRQGEHGVTLVEAVVSLVIVATAIIPALSALGSASDNVLETTERRKMRYLSQIIMARIELGKVKQDEEEEPFEEGDTGTFEDFGEEYAPYQYAIEVLRPVTIVGGSGDPEEAGGEETAGGLLVGAPISNDGIGTQEEGQGQEAEGQVKRVVVVAIRRTGEDLYQDRIMRFMTYLANPGEEDQNLAPAGGGAGGEGGAAGGAAGDNAAGDASGAGRLGRSSSADSGRGK